MPAKRHPAQPRARPDVVADATAEIGPVARPPEPVLEGEIVEAVEAATELLGAELPDLGDVVGAELAEEAVTVSPGGPALVPLAGRSGVLVRDALTRYLAEINRFDRLQPEEEHELAVRYRVDGDREALAKLVTSNLRLVVAVALSFRRAFANVLDLIQEGNLGLLEAIDRFDPYKGTRLSTYATWWIRSRIVKHLLDNWRLVRVGTTNARRKLLYNLRQEKARLEAQGIQPTPKLLAERLGTTAEDVIAVDQAIGASDVSLDAPVSDEGSARRGDNLPSQAMSPEGQAAEAEMRGLLRKAIAEFSADLPVRERSLLGERILAEEPVTLQEIADREGVTREAVRQSEQRLTKRFRQFLAERFPDAGEIRFGE